MLFENIQSIPTGLVPVLYAHLTRRSTRLSGRVVRVDGWVQVRVVIHLHLAVDFESSFAREDLIPQRIEAVCEVAALLLQEREAGQVLLPVAFGGGRAAGLLGGVEHFEREDGEAIEDEAGGFGVERGVSVLLASGLEKDVIDLLDKVVAGLIEDVDGTLDSGNAGIGGAGLAGFVFGMPEIEVGTVICEDRSKERRWRKCAGIGPWLGAVPAVGGLIVELRDFQSIKHRNKLRPAEADTCNCIRMTDVAARSGGARATSAVVSIYHRRSCSHWQKPSLEHFDQRLGATNFNAE